MLALSPQFCSLGWILEDSISHEREKFEYLSSLKPETSNSINPPSSYNYSSINKIQTKKGKTGSLLQDEFYNGDENKMDKKLNHSANERHRRQKINTLYSTLKSLLPPQDQSRKLSIPATLSRVVKYIPELKKEVERLSKNKETLMSSKINSRVEKKYSQFDLKNQRKKSIQSTISATPISEQEIVIQSSMPKAKKRALSEVVMRLEQQGFLTVNATCFESFDGRVFYNLHLQAQGSQVLMDAEMLKDKVWPL